MSIPTPDAKTTPSGGIHFIEIAKSEHLDHVMGRVLQQHRVEATAVPQGTFASDKQVAVCLACGRVGIPRHREYQIEDDKRHHLAIMLAEAARRHASLQDD